MSKIIEAIEALAHNVTHPKILTEALTEIHEEFAAIKARLDGMDEVKAHAAATIILETTGAPVVPPVTA